MKKIFLILTCLFSTSLWAKYAGTNPLITPEQLLESPEKYVVLDVRSKQEFDDGHIEGAINIPHYSVMEKLDTINSWQDKTIVVHCRSGKRAWVAEQMLMKKNVNNLAHLKGDMLAWKASKLPLIKN